MPDPDLITIDGLAALIPKLTASAVYSQRKRNQAPGSLGFQIGRHLYFDRAEILEWLASWKNGNGRAA